MVSPPASPGAKASIIGSKRAALNSSQYQGKAEKKIEIPRLNSSLIAEYNEARAEALPLTRAANYDVAMSYFRCGDSNYDPDKASKSKVSLWRMLSYSTPKERAWMVFGVIMATFSGLGVPMWLLILAKTLNTFSSLALLMDQLGDTSSFEEYLRSELNKLCLAFAGIGGVALVSGTCYVSIWTYTGEKQALRIQKEFVRASLNQDAAWFDKNDREALPTKMGTALVHINNAIGKQFVDVYSNGISAIACLAVAFLLNAALTLVMLCVVPLILIIMAVFNIYIRRVKKRANSNLAEAGGIATEVLSGIKTVAALCAQPYFRKEYDTRVEQSSRFTKRATFLSSTLSGITGAIFYLTYTVAFYIGTEQVVTGAGMIKIIKCFISGEPQCRVTGAAVMCCIYGVILCVTFFGLMGPGLATLNLGQQSAVEVFETLRRIPVIDPSSTKGKKLVGGVKGKIEFRNMFFYYGNSPDKPIFYNFNLVVEAGQSIALVGPSGSGKSTIAKLLLRFYDPNQGDVIIDDEHSLTSLNVSSWRQQIGYVAQEPVLFPGTVRENIALGIPPDSDNPPTNEDIVQAAKMACAHEFIVDLPDGYDTVCGSTTQLSGGQMQRICIARALLRNPRILVLDEATSALDQLSEQHVQDALKNIRAKKKITTVTIAHRLTTIIESDAIAVIANGKIAELGNHETLLQKENGIYKLLCEDQGITSSSVISHSASSSDVRAVEESTSAPATNIGGDGKDIELSSSPSGHVELGLPQSPKSEYETIDEEQIKPSKVKMAPMSKIWNCVGLKDGMCTIIGLIGSGIVGALSPCESILTAQIVNTFYTVEPDEMVDYNMQFITKFLYFALAAFIGNVMVGFGLSRSGSNLGAKMRTTAFQAMLQRSMGWFDDPDNTTGELTTILGADAEAVEALTGPPLGFRVRVLSSIITGVAIALSYSLRIGLVSIACVPFIMLAGLMQVVCSRSRVSSTVNGPSPATIMEQGLRGITSVQAYNLETKVGDDYARALEPESAGKMKKGAIAGFVFGFSQMAIFVSFAVVFFSGAQMLSSFDISFVDFFTSVLAVMFGALGSSQVSADFNSRQRGKIAAARIFSVMDGPSDGSGEEGGEVVPIDGDIKFENVKFAYPLRPDNPIFYSSSERDGVNIEVARKESIGFVGRSGSGKSTILQIVLRFYEITGGSAKLDGREMKELNVNNLRKQIGYVGQLPTLFNGTVRQNILLGKQDATEEEIQAAAKNAQAHDFIMNLPDGYDTEVGPGGNLLSGGQKQRVAIARAIIRNPKILVLDEATAALDNESQKMVQQTLDEIHATNPRTTLTVAHRLLTVKDCDKIAFMGEGGVLEIGNHSELLELKGNYYDLWVLQNTEEELEQLKTN